MPPLQKAEHILEYEEVQPKARGERLYHLGVVDEELAPGVSSFLVHI